MKSIHIHILALVLVGCGGATGPLDETEEDLTSSFTYDCRLVHQKTDAVHVRVSKTKATLTVSDPNAFPQVNLPGTYTYNPNYKPSNPEFTGHAQYKHAADNTTLILEPELRTGGYALKIGGHGGFMTLEGGHVARGRVDLLCHR